MGLVVNSDSIFRLYTSAELEPEDEVEHTKEIKPERSYKLERMNEDSQLLTPEDLEAQGKVLWSERPSLDKRNVDNPHGRIYSIHRTSESISPIIAQQYGTRKIHSIGKDIQVYCKMLENNKGLYRIVRTRLGQEKEIWRRVMSLDLSEGE